MNFVFILDGIIAPAIALLGVTTNTFILAIYSSKSFAKKLPLKRILLFVSVIYSLYVLKILKNFIKAVFGVDVNSVSAASCKLMNFSSALNGILCWNLIYISMERLFAIKSPAVKLLMRKPIHQTSFIVASIVINMLVYSYRLVLYETNEYVDNKANSTQYKCEIAREHTNLEKLFSWFHMVNTALVPFMIMILSSSFLIYFISKSRKRMVASHSTTSQNIKMKIQRDVRFSAITVFSDVVFILCNIPVKLYFVIYGSYESTDRLFFSLADTFFYFGMTTNFFIYMAFNSMFRKQFEQIFSFGKIGKSSRYAVN